MPPRRRLDPDEMVPGQLDIDGRQITAADCQPSHSPRRKAPLRRGEPARYTPVTRRDELCLLCIQAQRDADVTGRPVPFRKRARWRREQHDGMLVQSVLLCHNHAQVMRSRDALPPLPTPKHQKR